MKVAALALVVVLLLQTLPMVVGTLSILGPVLEAEAQVLESVGEQLIERGRDHAVYDLGNYQRRAVFGLDPWVYDETQGRYIPHIVTLQPDGAVQVRSGMIGWNIRPDSAVITDSQGIEGRATEVWRIYLGDMELEKQYVTQTVNDYEGKVQVLNRYDIDINGTRAALTITWAIHDGRPTERIVQINGVSDELKSLVRIEREWLDIDTDELLYSTTESESRESVALQRKTIATDETGQYVRLMKGGKMLVHENLRTAGDKLDNVEYERGLVKFGYAGWEARTTVRLTDDTYADASPTAAGRVGTASATGTTCGAVDNNSFNINTRPTAAANDASQSVTGCFRGFVEWDISSIPAGTTVTDTVFKFHVISVSGLGDRDVQVRAMTGTQPSIGSASNVWNEIGGGTTYVSSLDETTGTNKSQDLGISADSDVEAQLSSDWFAIGIMLSDETRVSGLSHFHQLATTAFDSPVPNPTLEVIYTAPQQYDRAPGDTITFSDSIAVVLVAARSGADSWVTSESIARMYASFRSVAETATISDSALRKLLASRDSSDTVTVTDSIAGELAGSRSTTDAVAVTDSITYTVKKEAQASDAITVSESVAASYNAARSVSESLTISDSIGAVHVEAVEIPITLNAGSGSPTFQDKGVSATISCQYGGSHDGDPAQQEFQCLAGETVTISLPSSTATERWVWSNGSTGNMSFTTCSTGTCDEVSFTYYLQELQTVTLQGLDVVRTASITRTQLGSQGTTAVSGSTSTPIWADYGTPFSIPDTVIIVANEYRFKSYDEASYLSYTVDDAYTKTPTYQREFNILFRVHEEHEGVIFAPMPAAIFTGTIEAADSQVFNLNFDTQVTDDHLQPSMGRVWIVNGTAMWQNITWQGMVVNATGSAPITAYGNFDIESSSKHLGFNPEQHFRIAVNNADAVTDVQFDRPINTLTFTAEASGIQDVKLEFLIDIFDDVQSVSVDGEMLPVDRWSVVKPGGGIAYLTVEDVAFSTHDFLIIFNPSGIGSGSGGGAGSGSSSGSGIIDFFTNPLQNVPIITQEQTRTGLKVSVPAVNVAPGDSERVIMTVSWSGSSILEVTSIQFLENPQWFRVDSPLPHIAALQPDSERVEAKIPVIVTVPKDVRGSGQSINVYVVATSNGVVSSTTEAVQLNYTSTANIALIFGAVFAVVIGVGAASRAYARRTMR